MLVWNSFSPEDFKLEKLKAPVFGLGNSNGSAILSPAPLQWFNHTPGMICDFWFLLSIAREDHMLFAYGS